MQLNKWTDITKEGISELEYSGCGFGPWVMPFVTRWIIATRFLCPWDFPGKVTEVGCHLLLQGIFSIQGPNPGLPHYRQIIYPLAIREAPELKQKNE